MVTAREGMMPAKGLEIRSRAVFQQQPQHGRWQAMIAALAARMEQI